MQECSRDFAKNHWKGYSANNPYADADAGFVAGERCQVSLARKEVKYACGTTIFAFNNCHQLISMHYNIEKSASKSAADGQTKSELKF